VKIGIPKSINNDEFLKSREKVLETSKGNPIFGKIPTDSSIAVFY